MKKSLGPRTLIYPNPVFLVGTYDAAGRPNIMTAAWAGICCSQPPCLAVSLRKATYSYGNIMGSRAFTVSIPSTSQVREADWAGTQSGRHEDKFAALGLTAQRSEMVHAPYVAECPVVLECSLLQSIELGLHTQFVGEIVDVKAEENLLDGDGLPPIAKVDPLIYSAADKSYYAVGRRVAPAFTEGKRK